ncbi:diacylglycerol kinase family protein [Shouchella shacheensis]|uniref:diacylglycerol kinase family protein n=1 Tax=Shouchella shacheensis TaxID=1649580 RepID=UPI00073FBC35|nr:diacylglycerol kinase family protein [Shouchella shacheensis]
MGLEDRNRRGGRRLLRSFRFAFEGLLHVVKNEQNMQIHLVAGVVVLTLGFLLNIPLAHWLILLLVVGGMLTLEIMNTAIERTVDLVSEDYHPLAKRAKDVAAAAVFVFCLFAIGIGLLIFIPPMVALF